MVFPLMRLPIRGSGVDEGFRSLNPIPLMRQGGGGEHMPTLIPNGPDAMLRRKQAAAALSFEAGFPIAEAGPWRPRRRAAVARLIASSAASHCIAGVMHWPGPRDG